MNGWDGFTWRKFAGHDLRVDPEADMGYIEVRPHQHSDHTDLKHQRQGIILDRDHNGTLLGIEVFLRDGEVRPESAEVIRRLLRV